MRLFPSMITVAAFALAIPASAQTAAADPAIERYYKLARAEYSGDRARALVAFMDGRFRWPGNAAFDTSIDQIVRQLRAAGYQLEDSARSAPLTYRIERRPLRGPAWDLIGASVTLEGRSTPLLRTATNLNMLAINSWSTPDTGLLADVIDVGKGTPADFERAGSVEGRIVLAEGPVGRVFSEAVQKHGAAGVFAYSLPAYTKPEVNRNSIQFSSIAYDTVRRAWGMPISRNALDTLRAALARGRLRVRVRTAARFFPSVERTVVAEVHGSDLPQERFVFSAHVQEPGANDNASGVGALAEMARVFALLHQRGDVRPRRTITMLFGNEIAQTRNFLADDSVRTRGVKWGLSLDMVGEDTKKTGGTFLIEKMPDPSAVFTRGDDHHTEWGGSTLTKDRIVPHYFNDFLLARCLEQASTSGWVVRTNPFEGGSDHTPFLTYHKPGVLFWHFTDQFYHTDGDRIGNVSTETLRNVGISALVSALTLTNADGATTRSLIAEFERAAIRRLDTELALSRTALAGGGPLDHEREILETWTDYYVRSAATLSDVEAGGTSPTTQVAIDASRSRIRAAGNARIQALSLR